MGKARVVLVVVSGFGLGWALGWLAHEISAGGASKNPKATKQLPTRITLSPSRAPASPAATPAGAPGEGAEEKSENEEGGRREVGGRK